MCAKAGLAVEILAGTMVTARPNRPAMRRYRKQLVSPLAVERTALACDILLPPLLIVSFMLCVSFSFLCIPDWRIARRSVGSNRRRRRNIIACSPLG